MRKYYSIDQLSTASTRQAQSELAMMRRDLNKLRDSMFGLTRGIKAPQTRAPRTRTKRTTSSPFDIFGFNDRSLVNSGVGDLLNMAGLSGGGYVSAAQKAGASLALLALGQRIR